MAGLIDQCFENLAHLRLIGEMANRRTKQRPLHKAIRRDGLGNGLSAATCTRRRLPPPTGIRGEKSVGL